MSVKGVFASDSGIVGDRKGDFASGLLRTQPTGTAALLALTAGMESVDASDTVITWFEENHNSGRINATNNAGTGTSVIVDAGLRDAIARCDRKISLPEPEGCGDPCP